MAYIIAYCLLVPSHHHIIQKQGIAYMDHLLSRVESWFPQTLKSAWIWMPSWKVLDIAPASMKLKGGYTGFTSPVHPSVRLSVCPSVCGQNRVRSVTFTILAGSISHLHILLSNFRCVTCNVSLQNSKIWIIVWLCLVLTWDLIWISTMGSRGWVGVGGGRGWGVWRGVGGYFQNAGILVGLVQSALKMGNFPWKVLGNDFMLYGLEKYRHQKNLIS